ncbi:hypothetical protein PMAYCL1PPCAC_12829, partial [Pristionchus mayeri]
DMADVLKNVATIMQFEVEEKVISQPGTEEQINATKWGNSYSDKCSDCSRVPILKKTADDGWKVLSLCGTCGTKMICRERTRTYTQ